MVRSRPEAGAGIEKSGRGSRAPDQIQKFVFPPELSPNFWLPVTAYEAVEAVEVGLRSQWTEDGLEVIAVMCEDEGVDFEVIRGLKIMLKAVRVAGQNILHSNIQLPVKIFSLNIPTQFETF